MKRLLLAAVCVAFGAQAAEFRWASGNDILGADPHINNHGLTNAFKATVYEGLTRRRPDGSAEPGLAERWELRSPDTMRFYLRKGVKFHGGEAFTADDVIFSWQRIQGADMAYTVGSIARIDKIDDHTIDMVTKGPNPVLLMDMLNFFIMSRSWTEANGGAQVARANVAGSNTNFMALNANGTGPFRLTERHADERTVMEPFAGHWEPQTHNITRATYRPIANAATRSAAIASGEVDLMYHVPLQNLQQFQQMSGVRVMQGPTARTIFLGLEVSRDELPDTPGKNPLKDLRVRQAISHAIDYTAIQRVVMRGSSQSAGLIIAPAIQGFDPKQNERLPFDLAGARRLLTEAGYPQGFTLTMMCPAGRYVNDETICTALVPMMQRIGITIRLSTMPMGQFLQRAQAGEAPFYMLGWTPGNFDVTNALQELLGPGTYNWGHYNNPELNALREQIQVETDMTKRNAMSAQALGIVRRDIPVIPLHQEPQVFAVRDTVADFKMMASEDVHLRYVTMK
jgi:peptide/nickel transport system substrate-binding protein